MQKVESNPYVIQIDKLVGSLDKLSRTYLSKKENERIVGSDVVHRVCEEVREKVCKGCESKRLWCRIECGDEAKNTEKVQSFA